MQKQNVSFMKKLLKSLKVLQGRVSKVFAGSSLKHKMMVNFKINENDKQMSFPKMLLKSFYIFYLERVLRVRKFKGMISVREFRGGGQ